MYDIPYRINHIITGSSVSLNMATEYMLKRSGEGMEYCLLTPLFIGTTSVAMFIFYWSTLVSFRISSSLPHTIECFSVVYEASKNVDVSASLC